MEIKDFNPDNLVKNSNSLNSLSPYIGRLRPECANYLIRTYADPEKPVFDPFCGSGTVLLQGWIAGHNVYGNDLNPYAYVLSLGKLHPYRNEVEAIDRINYYDRIVGKKKAFVDSSAVPLWVKDFYHIETLREIIAWFSILKSNKEWFLLSCLLGILHHQRPGFLSYPASHGAPYLRTNKYPREEYPEMYEYRSVCEKLCKKIHRVFKDFPLVDYNLQRVVYNKNAATMRLHALEPGTIITSPPYMRSLTYARDNRLRLWFLGVDDWESLDRVISPSKEDYSTMMSNCFRKWARYQASGDKCIVVTGDISIRSNGSQIPLAYHIQEISRKNYSLIDAFQDPIPESHKLVKGHNNIKKEIIVVLERK